VLNNQVGHAVTRAKDRVADALDTAMALLCFVCLLLNAERAPALLQFCLLCTSLRIRIRSADPVLLDPILSWQTLGHDEDGSEVERGSPAVA
jgi:hypothetical protein